MGEIMKESHFYISDDKEHDTLFVQHCLMLHWQRLQNSGFVPKEHWVFSDGVQPNSREQEHCTS
jgi:hypothetical protein